jgi:glycine/D-amino acid oxidase-like deaminating enzyme
MVALQNIVIVGGGIVGNSIAYFLAKRNVPATLIDPVGIAPGASGKAGGFLARDWRDGTPLEQLQRKGFDLHQEIANELDPSKIDYRRLTCKAVSIDETQATKKPSNRKSKTLEWVDKGVIGSAPMGDENTIAQVHPKKLCDEMWRFSERQGSTLKIGRVTKVLTIVDEKENDRISGVELDDGTSILAEKLIVACGPWTEQARSWFPPHVQGQIPEITGVKCHSILVRSPKILSEAVFLESEGSSLGDASIEVYPRPDGDVYVNGFEGDEVIVSEEPGREMVESEAVANLQQAMGKTTSLLDGVDAHTQQVCYWPETPDGLPIIDQISRIEGAYLACGHSVWGILQGPITGKAMAEKLLDGESSCIDLTPFQLSRFDAVADDEMF